MIGCRTCGQIVKPKNGYVECCGFKERIYSSGVRDLQGRLHGPQPQIGTGEVSYTYGTLDYLDDGNGNVFDSNDYDEDYP